MTLRRTLSIGLSIVALALAACGDDDEKGGFVYADDGQLQVMTRNLYLGGDLTPLLGAATQDEFVAAANSLIQSVTVTNSFAVRAGAIANEIAATRPDLVGLQEVSLWRTQSPGDGGATPATTVMFDFLAILQGELLARGLPYDVAEEIELFDFEAPVPISTTAVTDVRLTDRQVILAISGLPTSNARGGVFSTRLPIQVFDPVAGTTTLEITRGWTAVSATVGGRQITFYNTHLEAFGEPVRDAQASELSGILDAEPIASTVLVGDLNSAPDGAGGAGSAAYDLLRAGGAGGAFADLWDDRNPGDPGLTCCFDPNLQVTTTPLVSRIDHILWRGALPAVSATRVGEDLADRIGTPPRWPSDHAGVVGVFDP